jgi:large subunit ribosomal protein L25
MDFQRIVDDVKIKMNVPIHFIGEEDAIGVREGGGSVSRLRTDVEVTCLPKDLPEYFEIDITALQLDEMLHLSDITLPEGVEIPELAQGAEHDQAIVSIHVIKVAIIEEDIDEEEISAEVPVAGEEEGADDEEDSDSSDEK